jgi:hypothetical protein
MLNSAYAGARGRGRVCLVGFSLEIFCFSLFQQRRAAFNERNPYTRPSNTGLQARSQAGPK